MFPPLAFVQAAHLTPLVASIILSIDIPALIIDDAYLPSDSAFATHPPDLPGSMNTSTRLPSASLFIVIYNLPHAVCLTYVLPSSLPPRSFLVTGLI